MKRSVPAYFDFLIDGFSRGVVGRCVHLGHWDEPCAGASMAPDEFARAQDRLDETLLGMADLRDGQSVLDVGCGFGGSLQKVDSRVRHARLVGVNIDPRQLAICRQLKPHETNIFEWVEADGCELPFQNETFDRVLCIEAMFHFASRQRFFIEAARVLRERGVLVVSDLSLDGESTAAELPGFCIEAMLRDGYGPWPEPWLEGGDCRGLGEAAGFSCTRYLDATAETRPTHRFTVPPHLSDRRDPGEPTLRAGLMLKWLHEHGHLRCVYVRFDKPAFR